MKNWKKYLLIAAICVVAALGTYIYAQSNATPLTQKSPVLIIAVIGGVRYSQFNLSPNETWRFRGCPGTACSGPYPLEPYGTLNYTGMHFSYAGGIPVIWSCYPTESFIVGAPDPYLGCMSPSPILPGLFGYKIYGYQNSSFKYTSTTSSTTSIVPIVQSPGSWLTVTQNTFSVNQGITFMVSNLTPNGSWILYSVQGYQITASHTLNGIGAGSLFYNVGSDSALYDTVSSSNDTAEVYASDGVKYTNYLTLHLH